MISLESGGVLARYFVWSCDHLPMTTAWYTVKEDGKNIERSRNGAHYIEQGTTLCHIFWSILWVPLFSVAIASFAILVICAVHVGLHNGFMRSHSDAGPLVDVATYFFPEAFVLGVALLAGCLVFAIIGISKVGFFSLLWQYLKSIKQRVCPLVRFGGT
jgi:hypothetical protein